MSGSAKRRDGVTVRLQEGGGAKEKGSHGKSPVKKRKSSSTASDTPAKKAVFPPSRARRQRGSQNRERGSRLDSTIICTTICTTHDRKPQEGFKLTICDPSAQGREVCMCKQKFHTLNTLEKREPLNPAAMEQEVAGVIGGCSTSGGAASGGGDHPKAASSAGASAAVQATPIPNYETSNPKRETRNLRRFEV